MAGKQGVKVIYDGTIADAHLAIEKARLANPGYTGSIIALPITLRGKRNKENKSHGYQQLSIGWQQDE